jgi:hypothetical protein
MVVGGYSTLQLVVDGDPGVATTLFVNRLRDLVALLRRYLAPDGDVDANPLAEPLLTTLCRTLLMLPVAFPDVYDAEVYNPDIAEEPAVEADTKVTCCLQWHIFNERRNHTESLVVLVRGGHAVATAGRIRVLGSVVGDGWIPLPAGQHAEEWVRRVNCVIDVDELVRLATTVLEPQAYIVAFPVVGSVLFVWNLSGLPGRPCGGGSAWCDTEQEPDPSAHCYSTPGEIDYRERFAVERSRATYEVGANFVRASAPSQTPKSVKIREYE